MGFARGGLCALLGGIDVRKIKLKPLNPKKLPMFIIPYPNEWATLMAEGFEQHSKAKLWENILEGIRRLSCGKLKHGRRAG